MTKLNYTLGVSNEDMPGTAIRWWPV